MSELKSETSRQNGAQSQGPVTPEGKAVSSQNSLRDGFYSVKTILIKGESQEEYDRHCARIRASWETLTGHEEIQVDDLCRIEWKILRCDRKEAEAEDAAAAAEVPDYQRIEKLSLQRARLENSKMKIIKELRLSTAGNEKIRQDEMDLALTIRRADRRAGRPTPDLKPMGFRFVLTTEQIDNEIAYLNLYHRAERELSTPRAA